MSGRIFQDGSGTGGDPRIAADDLGDIIDE